MKYCFRLKRIWLFAAITLLLVAVPLFLGAAYRTVYAENVISDVLLTPSDADYVEFSSPALLDANRRIAVLDEGEFRVFDGEVDYKMSFTGEVRDFAIFGDALIILDSTGKLACYDYSDGSEIIEIDVDADGSYSPQQLSIVDDKLYVSTRVRLYRYSLVADEAQNTITATLDYTFANEDTIIIGLYATQKGAYLYNVFGILYFYDGTDIHEIANRSLSTSNNTAPMLAVSDSTDVNLYYCIGDNVTRYSVSQEQEYISTLDYSPSGISLHDGVLYLSNKEGRAVNRYDLDLKKTGYYGSFGNEGNRLNNANALAAVGNRLYISDSGNNRIVAHLLNNGAIVSTAIIDNITGVSSLVADSKNVYYLTENNNGLSIIGESRSYIDYTEKLIAISAEDDVLFALSASGRVLKLVNNELRTLFFAPTAFNLSSNKYADVIYLADNNGITAYTAQGTPIEYLSFSYTALGLNNLSTEGSTSYSFDIDNQSNIYLHSGNRLYTLPYSNNSYQTKQEFLLADDVLDIAFGEKLYTLRQYRLGYAETSIIGYTGTPIEAVTAPNVTSATDICKTNSSALLLRNPFDFADFEEVSEGSYLLKKATAVYNNIEYHYVERNGIDYYILSSSCVTLQKETPLTENNLVQPLHYNSLSVYSYPSTTADVLFRNIDYREILTVIRRVGIDEDKDVWGWYEVSYKGQIGYVDKDFVATYKTPDKPIVTYYAKVRAEGINGKVAVYAEADTESEIIFQLTDGVEVELFSDLDKDSQFTYITIDGQSGYILSENLIEKGLTNGQIIAIVLVCVGGVGLAVLFIVLKNRRRY